MKKIIVSLLAVLGLVACGTKTTQPVPVDPWQECQVLFDTVLVQYKAAPTREVADSIINDFVQQAYQLVLTHVDSVQTDSIVLSFFYMFSPEQKDSIFQAMAPERWTTEGMQKIYKQYRAELLTAPGQKYIDVQALQTNGKAVKLSELVGKTDYLLVDFWASWCRPCRQLIPHLKDLYAKYHKSGKLAIVGISVDRDRDAWLQALKEEQMKWLQLHDTHEAPNNPSDSYGISAIPTTLLIDSEGTIVLRNPSEEEIAEILDK
jgi:peroxiredoxin